jgi:hypothetical protein
MSARIFAAVARFAGAGLIVFIGLVPEAAAEVTRPAIAIARPALTRLAPAPFARARLLRAAGLAVEPPAPAYASPLWFAALRLPARDTAAQIAHLRALADAQRAEVRYQNPPARP